MSCMSQIKPSVHCFNNYYQGALERGALNLQLLHLCSQADSRRAVKRCMCGGRNAATFVGEIAERQRDLYSLARRILHDGEKFWQAYDDPPVILCCSAPPRVQMTPSPTTPSPSTAAASPSSTGPTSRPHGPSSSCGNWSRYWGSCSALLWCSHAHLSFRVSTL